MMTELWSSVAPALAPLLATGAAPPYLVQGASLLVAGAAIAYVCSRLGLVPIVGFLIAGAVIGPHALGLVKDQEMIDAVAEIGVILLLFTIGLEFNLATLSRIQRLILGGGSLQVGLASVVTMGLLVAFGVDWHAALFTGFLVALSSTAIVLKLFNDRGETNSSHGQVALGLLIFQDLAVIVMVLLLPMLAGRGGDTSAIFVALGKAVGLIVLVLVVARRLMPPVLERVARTCSPELFLLTVVAICFGTAYLTSLAGVSVSLGAFLAGLVVSESAFSQQAFSEIMPLQIVFSATFFVSVGMLLNVGFMVTHLPMILAAVLLVALIKIATTLASVTALGYALPTAAASSLALAQVGEFSFVLERAGRALGLTPVGGGADASQAFIATTVLLMVATPFLTLVGSHLASKVERKQRARGAASIEPTPLAPAHGRPENHVIIAGYGAAAHQLVRVLNGSRIPYVITTLSPTGAAEAEGEGLPVVRGDASKLLTLSHAGLDRARMIVIADDDPATAHRIAAVARPVAPEARIVVRTRYAAEIEPMKHSGVDHVIAAELESVVQLFADVLRTYEVAPEEIEAHEETVRRGGYAALREEGVPDAPLVVCNLPTPAGAAKKPASAAGAAAGAGAASVSAAAMPLAAVPLAAEAPAPAPAPARVTKETAMRRPRPTFDMERRYQVTLTDGAPCAHVPQTQAVFPSAPGCEECLKTGDQWVHLRICLTCGHVGCCDSSPNKHATKHHGHTHHPIVRSLEPGEDWSWCYVDEAIL
jgi:CPA2 family monovalent cation:H+ antiporter-2